jgi:hypothetical protein
MDCARIDVVGYHFGTAEPQEAEQTEQHLLACTACLQAFLAVKRHADEATRARPGPEVRARLRRDVANAFSPSVVVGLVRWASRPIPLYKGVAAMAAFVAAGILASAVLGSPRHALRPEQGAVDTSRPNASSISIL